MSEAEVPATQQATKTPPSPKMERVRPEMSEDAKAALAMIQSQVLGGAMEPEEATAQSLLPDDAPPAEQPREQPAPPKGAPEPAKKQAKPAKAETSADDGQDASKDELLERLSEIETKYNRLKAKAGDDGRKLGQEKKSLEEELQALREENLRLKASTQEPPSPNGQTAKDRAPSQEQNWQPIPTDQVLGTLDQVVPGWRKELEEAGYNPEESVIQQKPLFNAMIAMGREIAGALQSLNEFRANYERSQELAKRGLNENVLESIMEDPRAAWLAKLSPDEQLAAIELVQSGMGYPAKPTPSQGAQPTPRRDPRSTVEVGGISPSTTSTTGTPNLSRIVRDRGVDEARAAAAPLFQQLARAHGLRED